MKHRSILYILPIVLLTTSCKKWLEVEPATQVRETEQFSTARGFKDALYGAYTTAAQRSLYGEELTFGAMEIMSQGYDNTTKVDHARLRYATYDYTNIAVQNTINTAWNQMYSAVAQLNLILKNVDAQKTVFSGSDYNLVKGEALGMRAMLHFDLLRLFAPAPASKADAHGIPYMKLFTVQPQAKQTVQEVIKNCLADLKEAETLLSVYPQQDSITSPAGSTTDNFLSYRQNHFNYWAVKALIARISLYNNDKPTALKYALEVINSKNFRFITTPEVNTAEATLNRTATFEHIFSLYVSNLKTATDLYFKMSPGQNANTKYTISDVRRKEVFEITKGNSTDIRYATTALWNTSNGIVFPSKLWQVDETGENYKKRIPLIKLSEMYYIAAEAAPTAAEGAGYLNTVIRARTIPQLATNIDQATLTNEIYKEYRKDFLCEGQLFFYYKRLNQSKITGALNSSITDAQYVWPMPNQEIEFGK
ncbi:RagB/SusD family nutrient uptake outer membrane protein [Chitinophaga sp. sic0106]|uniref:RagB/SusD family nutrient uptake outer membrane protein n=1 Tax=Chitinophaga sp. sic0106 TaxID=2854785 RepID=UPI001C440616|nr:RagB/SusD family nutrient uptake outer membrane protein [Chitinophaga sp. sic0106]MBV7531400.1 RagB/SusD family nutrient uptake outer membrane protein [Chitinophaga sp. sic0106]